MPLSDTAPVNVGTEDPRDGEDDSDEELDDDSSSSGSAFPLAAALSHLSLQREDASAWYAHDEYPMAQVKKTQNTLYIILYYFAKLPPPAFIHVRHCECPHAEHQTELKTVGVLKGHESRVFKAVFSPIDDTLLATCSEDATCRLWDVAQ